MRFDRMTIKLQDAINKARTFCEEERQQVLEAEHILLVLLKDSESIVPALIKKAGANIDKLSIELENRRKKYPTITGTIGQIYLSNLIKKLFDRSFEEAKQLKDDFVSSEHFLLAVSSDSVSGSIFNANGINRESLIKAISMCFPVKFEFAITLFKAPSNSLTFDLTFCAIKKALSSSSL